MHHTEAELPKRNRKLLKLKQIGIGQLLHQKTEKNRLLKTKLLLKLLKRSYKIIKNSKVFIPINLLRKYWKTKLKDSYLLKLVATIIHLSWANFKNVEPWIKMILATYHICINVQLYEYKSLSISKYLETIS